MSSLISQQPRPSSPAPSLYDRDGYAWAKQQAEALRRRNMEAIDWENVIEEIEAGGRAERRVWVSNCAAAIERMLLVEHWKAPNAEDLREWQGEIHGFQLKMAGAVDANPSLQGEYAGMLAQAWTSGRRKAVTRLAEHSSDKAGASDNRLYRRVVRATLPEDCPYLVEHVAAYDPNVDKDPRDDVVPPGVARVFNRVLGEDYQILRGSPSRDLGWSR